MMVFAHGIGGAKDLPIAAGVRHRRRVRGPGDLLIVLALAWQTSRFDAATQGTPVPGWLARMVVSSGFAATIRASGFAFFS